MDKTIFCFHRINGSVELFFFFFVKYIQTVLLLFYFILFNSNLKINKSELSGRKECLFLSFRHCIEHLPGVLMHRTPGLILIWVLRDIGTFSGPWSMLRNSKFESGIDLLVSVWISIQMILFLSTSDDIIVAFAQKHQLFVTQNHVRITKNLALITRLYFITWLRTYWLIMNNLALIKKLVK